MKHCMPRFRMQFEINRNYCFNVISKILYDTANKSHVYNFFILEEATSDNRAKGLDLKYCF